MKKGTRIGHVAQIPKFDEAMTVYDVLSSAFKVEKELEKEMHALEKIWRRSRNNLLCKS